MKGGYFLLFLIFTGAALRAQSWQWTLQLGSEGNEGLEALETDASGNVIATGIFTGSLQIGGTEIRSNGQEDLWLAKISPEGAVLWSLNGGGPRQDEPVDVAVDREGNIYWSGFFRESVQIGNWTAETDNAFKSIFILKIAPDGSILWSKVLTGAGSKGLGKMALDADDNLLLTGFFTDSLFVDQWQFSAKAGDFFLFKMDKNGQADWFYQSGLEGTIEGESVAVLPDGNIAVAGTFQGKFQFASDTLATNTPDTDIFLLAFSPEGAPLWSRKAGGVYAAFCTGLVADDAGNLYLTGRHLGVIKLNDDIQIQSQGLNDNFFLLAYDAGGEPRWARSYGGSMTEQCDDIRFWQNKLIIAGSFSGDFQLDGRDILKTSGFYNAFTGIFSTEGDLIDIRVVAADAFALGKALALSPEGSAVVGLSFSGSLLLEANPLISNGFFDVFIGKMQEAFTPVLEKNVTPPTVFLYPNPAPQGAEIRIGNLGPNAICRIFDVGGRLIFEVEARCVEAECILPLHILPLPILPTGFYFVKILDEKTNASGPVLKLIIH